MKQLRGTDLKRFVKAIKPPAGELVFCLHDVEDPVNVGSAFRIADAAGVRRMILTGITPAPPHKLISKVGRGKEKRVSHSYFRDIEEALTGLKEDGFHLCAVELTDQSVPYAEYVYPERTCLVVGHEDHGVTKKALALCDSSVYIPMYGKGASLNVHVALGIVGFEVMRRWSG